MEENHKEGALKEEVLSEAAESEQTGTTKHQIIKYIGVWLAIVAVFFVFNLAIKTFAANRNAATYQNSSYSSGSGAGGVGQPVSNSSAAQAGNPGQYDAAGGSCCGSGGGSCCPTGTAQQGGAPASGSPTKDFSQLEKAAIAWYSQNFGDSNVTAEVKDFGCHQQITIKKDGQPVKELAYRNNQFEVLGQ